MLARIAQFKAPSYIGVALGAELFGLVAYKTVFRFEKTEHGVKAFFSPGHHFGMQNTPLIQGNVISRHRINRFFQYKPLQRPGLGHQNSPAQNENSQESKAPSDIFHGASPLFRAVSSGISALPKIPATPATSSSSPYLEKLFLSAVLHCAHPVATQFNPVLPRKAETTRARANEAETIFSVCSAVALHPPPQHNVLPILYLAGIS
jgi:hypothetical protein